MGTERSGTLSLHRNVDAEYRRNERNPRSMTAPIERRIRLQGSYNFRDIGGYASATGQTVRWKRLYRSDALHQLTPEDLEILQPLGVSTLLDLRSIGELELTGQSQLVSEQGAIHRHVPFVQDLDDHIDLTEFPPMSDL
jgi:hypothetical protein